MDDQALSKLQSDVAVILTICKSIQEDLIEIKSVAKNHNIRIRALEVRQGELGTEMRAKGTIAVAIAAIVSYFTEIINR